MEPVKDYELKAFFSYVVNVFEQLDIPYMVVGGFAAIFYGEPRFTLDVDIIADVKLHHIPQLASMFSFPDYYLSEEAIRDSLIRRYPFNIIQPTTGAKVDIVPLPSDAFTLAAFSRRQQRVYDESGRTASFITPEDIVIAKLVAFSNTESDKHLRDARGILVTLREQLDLKRLKKDALAIGLAEQLDKLLEMVGKNIKK